MERLAWDEIRKRYGGEWAWVVGLVWDGSAPYPAEGVVWAHAPSLRELDQLSPEDPPPGGASLVVHLAR